VNRLRGYPLMYNGHSYWWTCWGRCGQAAGYGRRGEGAHRPARCYERQRAHLPRNEQGDEHQQAPAGTSGAPVSLTFR
jgi:hypothetical protein